MSDASGYTEEEDFNAEIHVCQSGTCRSRGGEAALVEIEELANALPNDPCNVNPTGCLGYCSVGPAAVVIKPSRKPLNRSNIRSNSSHLEETIHVRINSFEKSAKVVEDATGKRPPMDSNQEKFADLRLARTRQYESSVYHWNSALRGFIEQVKRQPWLRGELEELFAKAGFGIKGVTEGNSEMPDTISQYTQWSLESVIPVSKHSVLYKLTSEDLKRSTPHPRGRGHLPTPVTWHTTLLAEVGANTEGPLPWIERDYTPVSTSKQWESGKCEILVKIYRDGAATSWLNVAHPSKVWLSKPVPTLEVPGLVPKGERAFYPKSVLLLLAGTGVVALPQILHHRDPLYKLGIGTPRRKRLQVPIDAIISFRDDDVLCIPQIEAYCREATVENSKTPQGLRHCTLLLTKANSTPAIFPDVEGGNGVEAEKALGLSNVQILRERMSSEIVLNALKRMPHPCRVVVSGPGGFNAAARGMLSGAIEEEQITILSA